MKRRTKNLTSVFCGAVFALALIAGGSVVASELKEVPAAAASHGVKISADDFDDTSFVLSSSTADAGGLLYSFAGAEYKGFSPRIFSLQFDDSLSLDERRAYGNFA